MHIKWTYKKHHRGFMIHQSSCGTFSIHPNHYGHNCWNLMSKIPYDPLPYQSIVKNFDTVSQAKSRAEQILKPILEQQ